MQITPAAITDISDLVAIYAASLQAAFLQRDLEFNESQLEGAHTKILQSVISEYERVYVARKDGKIVGFVTCGMLMQTLENGQRAGEIYRLYVDPDSWGEHIGEELMNAAFGELRERGYTYCLCWVPKDLERSISWYKSQGWEETDMERPDMDGAPVARMGMGVNIAQPAMSL